MRKELIYDTISDKHINDMLECHIELFKHKKMKKRTKDEESIILPRNKVCRLPNIIFSKVLKIIEFTKLKMELLSIYKYNFSIFTISFHRINYSNFELNNKTNKTKNKKHNIKYIQNSSFSSKYNLSKDIEYIQDNGTIYPECYTVIYFIRKDKGIKDSNFRYYDNNTRKTELKINTGTNLLYPGNTYYKHEVGSGFGCKDYIMIQFKKRIHIINNY
jgi:hypothetical protein